jgi:hypothetical protein
MNLWLVAAGVSVSILASGVSWATPAGDAREECKRNNKPDSAALFECLAKVVPNSGGHIPHPAAMEDPDWLKSANGKTDKQKLEEAKAEKPKHSETDKPTTNN